MQKLYQCLRCRATPAWPRSIRFIFTPDGRGPRHRRQDESRRQRPLPPPGLEALRDLEAEDAGERAAARGRLSASCKLDGNVGCLVNGAGLAMATMDLVKYYGGQPANFLDIGGSSQSREGGQRADHHPGRQERARPSCSTSSAASRAATTWRAGIVAAIEQMDIDAAHRGAPDRHQRGGGARDPAPSTDAAHRRDHGRGRAEGHRAAGRGREQCDARRTTNVSIPDRFRERRDRCRAGHHRPRRSLPHRRR